MTKPILYLVTNTLEPVHPRWCQPVDATFDVHQHGAGYHASQPVVLLELDGHPPLTGAISVAPGGVPIITIGLGLDVTVDDALEYAANLSALAKRARAA